MMKTDMMRKKAFHNLVKQNMHDFTRRAKDQIIKDRQEKFAKIKERNDELLRELSSGTIETLNTTPKGKDSKRMPIEERQVRNEFMSYIKSIVTKDGKIREDQQRQKQGNVLKKNLARSLNLKE